MNEIDKLIQTLQKIPETEKEKYIITSSISLAKIREKKDNRVIIDNQSRIFINPEYSTDDIYS